MSSQGAPFLLIIGLALIAVGVIQLGIARDRRLWQSYAVESFRYCTAIGFLMLGARYLWIFLFGDEPGVSFWGQASTITIAIGQLGMQMNNLARGSIHVPKFLRRTIE